MPRRTQGCGRCDRGAAHRGQHQSRAADELADAREGLRTDRRRRQRRDGGGACGDARRARARGGERDRALLRWRSRAGRTAHPRVSARPRRRSRGDAAAREDRHGAGRARRRRDAARGGAHDRPRPCRRAARLHPMPGRSAQIYRGARPSRVAARGRSRARRVSRARRDDRDRARRPGRRDRALSRSASPDAGLA